MAAAAYVFTTAAGTSDEGDAEALAGTDPAVAAEPAEVAAPAEVAGPVETAEPAAAEPPFEAAAPADVPTDLPSVAQAPAAVAGVEVAPGRRLVDTAPNLRRPVRPTAPGRWQSDRSGPVARGDHPAGPDGHGRGSGPVEPEAFAITLPEPAGAERTASIAPLAPIVSDAAPVADLTQPVPYAVAFPPTEIFQAVVDASPVMSGWSADLPFTTYPFSQTLIFETRGDAPGWMTRGQAIDTVNGVKVASLEDMRQAIRSTGAPRPDGSWAVSFGVRQPGEEAVTALAAQIPAIRQVVLLNGVSFVVSPDGDGWTTTVTESPFTREDELRAGDVMVGFIPTNESLIGPSTLSQILERELGEGRSVFDFAVNRDGALWVATMSYAADDAN